MPSIHQPTNKVASAYDCRPPGVPSSLLGVPALSLPLFELNGMPLGLQVIGYFDRDADAFAVASWLMQSR